ncbi:hypothetical protein PVAP13_7KG011173 [Panicum virgatum]|uniref:Uncharacterized protein n=1 Tax=Panicum virgatum TaxID=38727 RepID=A0A8T0QLL9_PANVG|nr:hypothetical protein PVAP13_7KG011173 [Panicum virgatum]
MAWQEGLRMAPEVKRRRQRRAALQQGRAMRDLLTRALAVTAGGAGPPARAAPAGRRCCAPSNSSRAGPGRCAGAAAGRCQTGEAGPGQGRGGGAVPGRQRDGAARHVAAAGRGRPGPAHRGGGGPGRPAGRGRVSERVRETRESVSESES